MAEVYMIMNSRPIVPISADPENACFLSPYVLLTQKEGDEVPPLQDLDTREMYKANWKYVQVLAEKFWKRWKDEFLQIFKQERNGRPRKITLKKEMLSC